MRNPTSQFIIRVCIRYKHIRDTIKACNRKQQAWGPYVHGQIEPHFQVPAIPHWFEWKPVTVIHIWNGERKEIFLFERKGERNETERG